MGLEVLEPCPLCGRNFCSGECSEDVDVGVWAESAREKYERELRETGYAVPAKCRPTPSREEPLDLDFNQLQKKPFVYDPQVDTLMIRLQPNRIFPVHIDLDVELFSGMTMAIDHEGNPYEIEILDASRQAPDLVAIASLVTYDD